MRVLDVFRECFAGHAKQFMLIGGTAATVAMEEAGLEFRARCSASTVLTGRSGSSSPNTKKDHDVVLHSEALISTFGDVLWSFVEAGGYEFRQASDTGRSVF